MASLNDFIDPDLTTSDVIHSTGYAQAASGSVMGGGAGGLSMDQRRKLLYGRKVVGSYAHSQLGQRYGAVRPRTADQKGSRGYDASSGSFSDNARYGKNRQGGGVRNQQQIDKPSIERRQHFIEPPARSHNPYA